VRIWKTGAAARKAAIIGLVLLPFVWLANWNEFFVGLARQCGGYYEDSHCVEQIAAVIAQSIGTASGPVLIVLAVCLIRNAAVRLWGALITTA
jgi:hypothetical protein